MIMISPAIYRIYFRHCADEDVAHRNVWLLPIKVIFISSTVSKEIIIQSILFVETLSSF